MKNLQRVGLVYGRIVIFFEGVLYRVWHNFHLKKIPALQKLLKKSCKGSHVKDRHPCFITKIPDFC